MVFYLARPRLGSTPVYPADTMELPNGLFVSNDPGRAFSYGIGQASRDGFELYSADIDPVNLCKERRISSRIDYRVMYKGGSKCPIRAIMLLGVYYRGRDGKWTRER